MEEAPSASLNVEPVPVRRAAAVPADRDVSRKVQAPAAGTFVGWLGLSAAVVVAYVAAAAMGFRLAYSAEQITTVWPPTGIAVSALLLGGFRLAPAVWIGALLANAGTSAPLWTAFVIATGNALEAVAAAWWLRKLPRVDCRLGRVGDVLAFVLVAAIACTAISATVGVATLGLAGVQSWERFAALWFDWWLGDALGAVVVAPAILTASGRVWLRRDYLRASMWIGGSILLTQATFGRLLGASPHPVEYVVFPFVIGAAVTGGPHLTSLVVLSASAATIWHTVHGSGPFASPQEVHHSLILLQVFMGVLAGTSLLLAAAIAERRATECRERDAAAALRHQEETLRESRDVLSLAMRSGSMGAWARNLVTNEVWWSRELEEIFGLQTGEFSRTEAGFFECVHEDDRQAVREAVDEALRSASDYVVEFRFRHASGAWRWMEGRGRAVCADDGTPRNLYGVGIDVTERKRAEIALREAKSAAESANQLKDEFLATLSHELRTPLNAILGYARMLQTNTIAPEKRQRAIDVIERNAIAQARLVEDLLDMSRVTAGKVRLDAQPVPVVTVLREAVDGVKPAVDAKGITLEIDFDPVAGTVRADTSRLQQMFWNVLANAVKFTSAGGRIAASLRRSGTDVEVVVTDTGVGIPSEFLPFVFEPFRQAAGRLDRVHGGLGLGLAITKQLVELHGGTIDVSSPGPGQGATVTIRLPRVNQSEAGGEPAAGEGSHPDTVVRHPDSPPSLAGVEILLVDDEEDTLALFRDTLEEAGARVRAVSTGADALCQTDTWKPDLLVTDLGLPGMDGYELLRAIRSKRSLRACPAVAVSAYARLDDRSRALAAGFQSHVAKPVDPATLVLALRKALSSAA